jgi:hypothetical protein
VIQKTLFAAALALMISTSYASAQCADCAMYPDRDHLNGGVQVPAARMGLMGPGGAASTSTPNGAAGARAQYMPQPGSRTVNRSKSRHRAPQ